MAAKSIHLKIKGMHCTGCEETVENAVVTLRGVQKVHADYVKQVVDVEFDSKFLPESDIRRAIEEKGYQLENSSIKSLSQHVRNGLVFLSFVLLVGGVTYWGKSMIPGLVGEMNAQLGYAMLFSIGFFTGFHCIGMCGGFVVGYAANIEPRYAGATAMAHLMYATGKTASYTVIGGSLGLLGSVMTFTPHMRAVVTLGASIFVVIYGLKMLGVLPVLRNFTLRLPRFLVRGVSNELRQRRSPLVIGLLNGLMLGCGPLQAMYVMAAGTGSAQEGATMLFFFGLGTLVPLLSFGLIASSISRDMINLLVRASAILVIAMGLMMAARGLKLIVPASDFNSVPSRSQQVLPADKILP
jgi:sulfite exporter TauE/SafE/copper chaperone CopZ